MMQFGSLNPPTCECHGVNFFFGVVNMLSYKFALNFFVGKMNNIHSGKYRVMHLILKYHIIQKFSQEIGKIRTVYMRSHSYRFSAFRRYIGPYKRRQAQKSVLKKFALR